MQAEYIYHSGFLVRCETCDLLIDYYKGGLPVRDTGKPLYVLASHFHQDHFSKKAFELGGFAGADVRYILSDDIRKSRRFMRERTERIIWLSAYDSYEDEILRIETLKSNDSGVAFLIAAGEETVYHAGDLNNWYWDPDEESEELRSAYRAELERIRGRRFDAAFVPLDPRLADHAFDGIVDFFAYADAETCYPMHMWDDYDIIERLKADPVSAGFRDKVVGKEFYEGPGQ